jgi:uncharacterized membrane protein
VSREDRMAEERAARPEHGMSEHELEMVIGRLLQIGVLIAGAVVLAGGLALLVQQGGSLANFSVFAGEPATLSTLTGVVSGAWHLHPRQVVQFGLILLIATPVARVAFTLVAFWAQRDRFYVGVTALVLALLLYGLIWGRG